ncbi:MAG: hypothetical protein AAF204_02220, partial [Pseudomonadota bacterium]
MTLNVNFNLENSGLSEAVVSPDGFTISEVTMDTVKGANAALLQIQGGAGHAFGNLSGGQNNSYENRESKKQRKVFEAIQLALEIKERLKEIEREKGELYNRINQLNELLHKIDADIKDTKIALKKICDELENAEDISAENLKRIAEINPITDKRFHELSAGFAERNPEAHKALMEGIVAVDKEYVTMVHGDRSHIVWQDKSGEYYIRNHETGERINIDQNDPHLLGALEELKPDNEGNVDKIAREGIEADEEAFRKYNDGYATYFKAIENDPELAELRQKMANILAAREELLGNEVLTQRTIVELRQQKIELEKKLDELENQKGLTEREIYDAKKRIEELNEEQERLENELKTLQERQVEQVKEIENFDDKTNQKLDQILSALKEKRDQLEEDHHVVEHNSEKIIDVVESFENRHAQLRSLYNPMNVRAAWEKSIKTEDGQHVYRDNIEPGSDTYLKLYTYN